MTLSEIVIPTPGLFYVAWIALIFGITWLVMFGTIIRKETRNENSTDAYKLVCLFCLMLFVVFSLVTNIGVVVENG